MVVTIRRDYRNREGSDVCLNREESDAYHIREKFEAGNINVMLPV